MPRRGAAALLAGALLLTGLVGAPVTAGPLDERPILGDCGVQGVDSKVTRSPEYEVGEAEVVHLKSDLDGVPIQMGIVHPDAPADYKSPVIVYATPYITADLRDVNLYDCSKELIRDFVRHGYTVVQLPVRGTGGSGGCNDVMGPKERHDVSQAVTWLGTREWSNGNVGMFGMSYDGSTPWGVASLGNPYLKTIIPADGTADLFELVFGRGETDWRWAAMASGYWGLYGYAMQNPVYSGRSVAMTVQDVVNCPDAAISQAATAESWYTGEVDSFGYWEQRRIRDEVIANYRGSVYLVQGFDDWSVRPATQFPWVNRLQSEGHIKDLKVLLGQWQHEWPRRHDFADSVLLWFDKWLKELPVDTGPAVEVEDSLGRWRTDVSWPPQGSDLSLYPGTNGSLSKTTSSATASQLLGPDLTSRYYYIGENEDSDPVNVFNGHENDVPAAIEKLCATCLAVEMRVRGEDLHISGLPEVTLRDVTSTGNGGQVTALLYRVTKKGMARRLGWGDVDLRFPDGGEQAQRVTPGASMDATIVFEPMDGVVPAGNRLLFIIGQGNAGHAPSWSRFPVNLGYGRDLVELRLPVVVPDPDTFFDPPTW